MTRRVDSWSRAGVYLAEWSVRVARLFLLGPHPRPPRPGQERTASPRARSIERVMRAGHVDPVFRTSTAAIESEGACNVGSRTNVQALPRGPVSSRRRRGCCDAAHRLGACTRGGGAG